MDAVFFGLSNLQLLFVNGGDAEDFQFLLAAGSRDFSDVAHFLVHQSPTDGRGGGNQTLCEISFFTGHQLINHFLGTLLLDVPDDDCGSKTYSISLFDKQGAYVSTHFVASVNANEITAVMIDAQMKATVSLFRLNEGGLPTQQATDLIATAYDYADSAEHREGIAAFMEKRTPEFSQAAAAQAVF